MSARIPVRLVVFAIVAFVLGLFAARALMPRGPGPAPALESATLFQPPRALSAFQLVDQDGRAVTPRSFEGRWTLVFFGFTHCPDVCPTTLAALAGTTKQLADLPTEQRPHVRLVSVDPERDTPEVLGDYVRYFDPSFEAATGTLPAVEKITTAFMVPFAKVPLPDGGYTVDHGAGVFLVSPAGQIVMYASPPLDPAVLARDYRRAVEFVIGENG